MINVIENLIDMFAVPGAAEVDRIAAIELRMILTLDPSAAPDLTQAVFAGQKIDVSKRAGTQRVLDILNVYGALDQQPAPKDFDGVCLKFHARPLIDLLKKLPYRDPNSGLSNDLIKRYFSDDDLLDN